MVFISIYEWFIHESHLQPFFPAEENMTHYFHILRILTLSDLAIRAGKRCNFNSSKRKTHVGSVMYINTRRPKIWTHITAAIHIMNVEDRECSFFLRKCACKIQRTAILINHMLKMTPGYRRSKPVQMYLIYVYIGRILGRWHTLFYIPDKRHGVTITMRAIGHHSLI